MQNFSKNPCFIRYLCYTPTMRFAMFTVGVWILALIASPIVATFLALVTFFTSFLGFFRGIAVGLNRIKSKETQPKRKPYVDIWEKHIERMEKQKQK